MSDNDITTGFISDITAAGAREPAGFLRGTRILTSTGEMPVEDLSAGDRVVTCFGGLQTIVRIGGPRFDPADRDHAPVRLRPGSLGEATPARDLHVAPGHAMLVSGALVPARSLVNGVSITQELGAAGNDYFQLDLGRHDCVIAEGTWSETDPAAPAACVPRLRHGMALYAALRPLVARAAAGRTPGTLRGFVDVVEAESTLHGWAQDLDHPELPVPLDIMLDHQVIGTVLACDFREDLRQEGIGPCSFVFQSPVRLRPASWPTIQVRRACDGALLDVSPALRGEPGTALRLVA